MTFNQDPFAPLINLNLRSFGPFWALRGFVQAASNVTTDDLSCSSPGPVPDEPIGVNYAESITGGWNNNVDTPGTIWVSTTGSVWNTHVISIEEDKPSPAEFPYALPFGPWEYTGGQLGPGGLVGGASVQGSDGPLMAPSGGGVFGAGTSRDYEVLSKPFVGGPVCCIPPGHSLPRFAATFVDEFQQIAIMNIDLSSIRFKTDVGLPEKRTMKPYAVAEGSVSNVLWALFKPEDEF